MSRLDDELRAAFRRVEPSQDFAERVMGRINNPPAPKPSLWQRFRSFFEPPVARWVAVGVATSLLVAMFAAQYTRIQEATPVNQAEDGIARQQPPPEIRTDSIAPLPEQQPRPVIKAKPVKHRTAPNKSLQARHRRERKQRLEAEQAKEQILLALQIASSTLNEANKMVRGDD